MPNLKKDIHIYIAIRNQTDRSQMEDTLVLDGFDVSSFATAKELWTQIQIRPARFVITDRLFGGEFSGLDLVAKIRKKYQLPYVYVLMRSAMERLGEIEAGLAGGVDDYLIKPHNPFQIRSRILVGLRWLKYIDSINVGTVKAAAASAQK
jgi:DNA-binding response OmpR family regulator